MDPKTLSAESPNSAAPCAAALELYPESLRTAYSQYLCAAYEEWQPQSQSEASFLERLAFNQFQLLRAQPLAAQALEHWRSHPGEESAEKAFTRISRHLRALERSAQLALRELRLLIEDRVRGQQLLAELSPAEQESAPLPAVFPLHRLLPSRPPTQRSRPSRDSEPQPSPPALRFVENPKQPPATPRSGS